MAVRPGRSRQFCRSPRSEHPGAASSRPVPQPSAAPRAATRGRSSPARRNVEPVLRFEGAHIYFTGMHTRERYWRIKHYSPPVRGVSVAALPLSLSRICLYLPERLYRYHPGRANAAAHAPASRPPIFLISPQAQLLTNIQYEPVQPVFI